METVVLGVLENRMDKLHDLIQAVHRVDPTTADTLQQLWKEEVWQTPVFDEGIQT